MSFSSIVNMSERARWYVVHTYSGYENKVKANLEKTIENRNLEHLLLDIQVPMEEVIEEKDGKEYGNGFDAALTYGYVVADTIIEDLK